MPSRWSKRYPAEKVVNEHENFVTKGEFYLSSNFISNMVRL